MTNGRNDARRSGPDHPANGCAMQPGFDAFPSTDQWDRWTELDPKAWPRREEHEYTLVPTTCFNCKSACGILAYVASVVQVILVIRLFQTGG